jgi:hypothetical protein
MSKIPSEVLIYLQTVKTYINNNPDARDYFIGESDEELFYTHLVEVSKKNFEKNGEVMLNKDQFEILRKTITVVTISKKDFSEGEVNNYDNIFQDIEGFGKICLN